MTMLVQNSFVQNSMNLLCTCGPNNDDYTSDGDGENLCTSIKMTWLDETLSNCIHKSNHYNFKDKS